MNATERRACLATLFWSQRTFADAIGWDEGTVRRWLRDRGEAPPEVDAWLKRRADAMEADRAPVKGMVPAPGAPTASWQWLRPDGTPADPTAQTEPLTRGQQIVARYQESLIAEPCELAEAIDRAIWDAVGAGP